MTTQLRILENILWLPLCQINKFGLNTLPSKTVAIPYTCGFLERLEATICIGLSARAATGGIFHPFHLGRQHPESPTPPTVRPRFTQLVHPISFTSSPSPDPQQNPLQRRRAHLGHVPALRRQAYLHCRSQHMTARASPSSFARQPPSSISMQ